MVTEPKLVTDEATTTVSRPNLKEGMKKIPSPSPGHPPLVDEKAAEELADLDKNTRKNQFRRREKIKDCIHVVKIISAWTALGFFISVLIIWGLHLVSPPSWQWIEDAEKLGTMRTILSAVGGGLVGMVVKKVLDND